MKEKNFLQYLASIVCMIAFVFALSCEGPAGPGGVDGLAGLNGTDGIDGNAVCMNCHSEAMKSRVTGEYNTSGHAAGAAVGYAGNRNDCAMCHSDQGFRETQYTNVDTCFSSLGGGAQPIQCATCHDFHPSLDFENEPNVALRTNSAVELLMYRAATPSSVVMLDLKDDSNLCANCHQPRTLAPVADGSGDAYISSSHYGPHHGPQSTTLAGLGAYEVGTGYPDAGTGSAHVTGSSCITCHMPDGNHSWTPTLEACNTTDCHGSMTPLTTLVDNARQTAFRTKMDELKSKLQTAGLIDADGHPVKGTYGVDSVGAVYNYGWLVDDRSSGVHNFNYTETLLNNTIAVFQ